MSYPVDYPQKLQDPDESRPAKRVRLDGALGVTEDTKEEMIDEEDWDDVYGDAAAAEDAKPTATEEQIGSGVEVQHEQPSATDIVVEADGGVPLPDDGLQGDGTLHIAPHEEVTHSTAQESLAHEKKDGLPRETVMDDDGQELVAQHDQLVQSTDEPSTRMAGELTEVEQNDQPANVAVSAAANDGEAPERSMSAGKLDAVTEPASAESPQPNKVPVQPLSKSEEDPEFLAAAEAQKDSTKAEWQLDSDAESSLDSDSSSGDSASDPDSDSEGGYEMLDAAAAAKILMAGEGDDDGDGGGKSKEGGNHGPRTANEVKEDRIPKPNVQITEETKITFLGTVERAVENMALIKASTSGEYQVLESGSVLCNEKREVIGAVAETLGRVQEPMYSVAFNSPAEIETLGMEHGAKVFYVDAHSTFVFTQPLKNMKGTDASNIHDEEIGEDELEFSDDEKEAEFKRQRKLAKKSGRGGISRSAFNAGERTYGAPGHDSGYTNIDRPYTNGSDGTQQSYGGGMNYDDEEGGDTEDFYQPLKRPDNLGEMMSGPPRPQQSSGRGRGRGGFDRGRGDRGRGRGRGERGRGRGGFNERSGRGGFDRNDRGGRGGNERNDRGGRGGQGRDSGFRGNAQSYPDSHNTDMPRQNGSRRTSHELPQKPSAPQGSSPPPPPPPQQYPQYPQQQSPSSYQFNGYTFQYGTQPPAPAPAPASTQGGYAGYQQPQQGGYGYQQPQAPPPGAYVNPAFYQGQQQQAGYGAYSAQQPYGQPQHGQAAPGAPAAQSQGDLADILRRLGGQGQ